MLKKYNEISSTAFDLKIVKCKTFTTLIILNEFAIIRVAYSDMAYKEGVEPNEVLKITNEIAD